MRRADMITRIDQRHEPWDMVIIGGGATGAGIAVDAASRGYNVVLLEQHDFGKGTSSRSTKLVHGGVRYLEQGNIALVMEALKERGLLRQNGVCSGRKTGRQQGCGERARQHRTPSFPTGAHVHEHMRKRCRTAVLQAGPRAAGRSDREPRRSESTYVEGIGYQRTGRPEGRRHTVG